MLSDVILTPAKIGGKPKKIEGFTLIEMSIVLIIIGFVVAGILVAQDLIKTANIRKVASELTQFSTAVAVFRGKYDCLLGDCANATTFFGTDSNGCPGGGGNGYLQWQWRWDY